MTKSLVEIISTTMNEILDGTLIGLHLGLDRFGPHDIGSDVFLMEPENYNLNLKQRVDEIYGLKHQGKPLYGACKKSASIVSYIPGVIFYPVEKMIHSAYLGYDFVSAKLKEKYPVLNRISAASAKLYLIDSPVSENLQKDAENTAEQAGIKADNFDKVVNQ